MITPGASFIVLASQWTAFKAIAITGKALLVQYDDDGDVYTIFALDGVECYQTTIWKGTVPDTVTPSYSQAQNDADKTDFVNNYLPTANARVTRTDRFGNPIATDSKLAIAMGIVPGASGATVNGYVATSATTTVAVRASSYVSGSANAQRSISSANVNDTSAGTGARTVKVTYYDNAMAGPFTETITLNGTTAVNTVSTTIRFIERVEVMTCGSGGGNAGTITLFLSTAGAGGTMAVVNTGDNQTFWAQHYVAAGKTCYVIGLRAGANVANGAVQLQAAGNPTSTTTPAKNITGALRHGSANQVHAALTWDPPLAVVGPNLLTITERPDVATASTALASFDYIEF